MASAAATEQETMTAQETPQEVHEPAYVQLNPYEGCTASEKEPDTYTLSDANGQEFGEISLYTHPTANEIVVGQHIVLIQLRNPNGSVQIYSLNTLGEVRRHDISAKDAQIGRAFGFMNVDSLALLTVGDPIVADKQQKPISEREYQIFTSLAGALRGRESASAICKIMDHVLDTDVVTGYVPLPDEIDIIPDLDEHRTGFRFNAQFDNGAEDTQLLVSNTMTDTGNHVVAIQYMDGLYVIDQVTGELQIYTDGTPLTYPQMHDLINMLNNQLTYTNLGSRRIDVRNAIQILTAMQALRASNSPLASNLRWLPYDAGIAHLPQLSTHDRWLVGKKKQYAGDDGWAL